MSIENLFSNSNFIAKRAFSLNGRRYEPGDVFDHKRRAITARRIRQLFDASWIMLADSSQVVDLPEPEFIAEPTLAVEDPEEEDF